MDSGEGGDKRCIPAISAVIIVTMADPLQFKASLAPEVQGLTPTLALMPMAILVTNQSGEVLWTNTWPEELAGYSGAQLVGEPAWKAEASATRDRAADRVAQVLETGKAWKGEVRWDGAESCYLELTITAIPQAAGTAAHALWTLNKISMETQAVTDLQRMSETFSAAQRAAGFGIFRWNIKTGKCEWPNEIYRLYGLDPTRDEASFDSWLRAIHPEDRAKTLELVTKNLQDPAVRLDICARTADGTRWISVRGKVFPDEHGNPEYADGIHLDVTEQVRLETALRASEERLALALEVASDGTWDWNIATGQVHFSTQWKRLLGAAEDEIGDDFAEWEKRLHADDRERVFAAVQAHLEGKDEQYIAEYRIRCQDGTWKWVLARGKVTNRSAEGKALRMVGAHTDISRQKELQDELRKREEQAWSLVTHLGEGIAYCRMKFEGEVPVDWLHEEVNSAYAGLIGLQDAAGKWASELVPELQARYPELLKTYGRVCRTGTPERLEQFLEPVQKWYAQTVYGIPPDRFAVVFQNITERKNAELELKKSHDLLSNLARMVPGMIYQYRMYPDGRAELPYVSPGVYRILELTPEKVSGDATPVFERVHAEDAARVFATIEQSARTLEMFYCEFRVVLPEQGLRWLLSHAKPERTEDGGTLWHGICSDITAQKRGEQEKERLTQQLMQTHKMESVGRLASGVAHDFNNLLTVILGYSGFLLEDLEPNTRLHQFAEAVQRSGERAASLTQQLLAFSRKQVIAPKLLDINQAIQDWVPMLERLIGEDVKLRAELDETPHYVMADPGQINQVIVNLVANARDAMPQGGELTIATSTRNLSAREAFAVDPDAIPGWYAMVTVADTGTGMDEETRQQIFEPFFTTKKVMTGTGLGLSTVFGIVRQSNGWIEVESRRGEGTTFRIYLPQTEGSEREQQAKVKKNDEAGTETILLIEDLDAVRTFTASVLKRQGYRVLEAMDGEEGLRVAAGYQTPIHLLLTDVVLPGMNGKMVADTLQALHPEMAVLFCSGYTADLIQQRGVSNQETAFLQKPFRPEDLLNKIRAVLGAQRLLKQDRPNRENDGD